MYLETRDIDETMDIYTDRVEERPEDHVLSAHEAAPHRRAVHDERQQSRK